MSATPRTDAASFSEYCEWIGGKRELVAAEDMRNLERELAALNEELCDAVSVLEFYAAPETYFAIGFFPDPPNGEFMGDFSDTKFGMKPGKRARDLFDKYSARYTATQTSTAQVGTAPLQEGVGQGASASDGNIK